jgi:hypothetical protein
MKLWAGVDCGKTGAFATIDEYGNVHSYHTPSITTRKKKRGKSKSGKTRYSSKTEYDLQGMLRIFARLPEECDITIAIEQQRQRQHDSKQVVFQIGYGMGLWDMACAAHGLVAKKVLPSQWKPCYVEVGADKAASVAKCMELYPEHALPLVKDEARAEAILIADYIRRQELGLEYPRTPPPKPKRTKKIT